MLVKQQMEQSVPMATRYAEDGKALSAVKGTPLDQMVSTCTIHGLFVEGRELKDYSLSDVLDFLAKDTAFADANGENEHGIVTDNLVKLAAKGVASALNLTRNVVVPDVKDVIAKIQELMTGYANSTMAPFVIEQVNQNEIFTDPLLIELVEKFHETPAREVPRRSIPPLDLGDVREKIRTGAEGFDDAVAKMLGDEGISWVNETFAGNVSLDELKPEYAIGVHLLCKAMDDEPPEGTRLSLLDYNTQMSMLIEQSGRITYQLIETARRRKKLGLLYVGPSVMVEGYREIHVDGEVYLKMLEEGLTPEVLFGNELLGRRYQASQLIEAKAELIAVYNREMRLRSTRDRMERTAKLREYLLAVVTAEINKRDQADLPVERSILHKRLAEFLTSVNDYQFDRIEVLCRDVVCWVFYAHTPARRIMAIMDRLGEEYTNADPRELALLATIEYVSVWVAKQIVVDKQ